MKVIPNQPLEHAPRALFKNVELRRDRARFMIPDGSGGWLPITWGEFGDEVRAAASYLLSIGFASGERGAVLGNNCVQWMSAAIGLQAAGGVMVPIYPSSTSEQLAYVVSFALLCSLIVALTVAPALCSRFLGGRAAGRPAFRTGQSLGVCCRSCGGRAGVAHR